MFFALCGAGDRPRCDADGGRIAIVGGTLVASTDGGTAGRSSRGLPVLPADGGLGPRMTGCAGGALC